MTLNSGQVRVIYDGKAVLIFGVYERQVLSPVIESVLGLLIALTAPTLLDLSSSLLVLKCCQVRLRLPISIMFNSV